MTEGCGSDGGPLRSATSSGAAPPPPLITCCYWSVKFEYAFSLLKVWLVLARGQQQMTVWLLPGFFSLSFSVLCFDLSLVCALVLLAIMHSSNSRGLRKRGREVDALMFCFRNGNDGLQFGFLSLVGLK